MSHPIQPGKVVDGYCGGYFGRDSYGRKRCVDSGYDNGVPWAVFLETDGYRDWHVLHGENDIAAALRHAEEKEDANTATM